MLKRGIILILVFLFLMMSLDLRADSIYGPFDFMRLSSEPITWNPNEGIYNKPINIKLTSVYGKIFYFVSNSFNLGEPTPYLDPIALNGKSGSVIDYTIHALLEKENGSIEIYSRTYRIDRTDQFFRNFYTGHDYLQTKFIEDPDKIKLDYSFSSGNYGISVGDREFIFPVPITQHANKSKLVELKKDKNRKSVYLVGAAYKKDGRPFTEVHSFSTERVPPPSFGSLYWGQVYKKNYKLKIKSYYPDDKVYYWIREWASKDLIVGPPLPADKEAWALYTEPIELATLYGDKGITGIAAFSIGNNGEYSSVNGPYYFKIDDVLNPANQVFEDDKPKLSLKKKRILVNGKEISKIPVVYYKEAVITFEEFDRDDRFYFTYTTALEDGQSELISCEQRYVIKNAEIQPMEMNLFLSTGDLVGTFTLYGEKMNLPVMKKYIGQRLDLTGDAVINFYMPDKKIRYELSSNEYEFLNVTLSSPVFNGSLTVSAAGGQEKLIKVKFGAFDENNNLLAESSDYYFKIDKKKPAQEVKGEGIDTTKYHNDKQTLILTPPEKEGQIYYRLAPGREWAPYDSPLTFYPPGGSKFAVKVYVKFTDRAGNERENQKPFEFNFDTRALFVDENNSLGSGTEIDPFNSLEKAVTAANERNIKLVYLLSNVTLTNPIKILGDVILQPYRPDNKLEIRMDSKSVKMRNHAWFDLLNGYLELRNLNFKIISGNYFVRMLRSKIKLYSLTILYSGTDDFCFVKNDEGKLGIRDLSLKVTGYPENLSFIDTSVSQNILNNLTIEAAGKNVDCFRIRKADQFTLEGLYLQVVAGKRLMFSQMDHSAAAMNQILYKQTGEFKNATIYSLKDSRLVISNSDFIIEGDDPFETLMGVLTNSEMQTVKSLFWCKKSVSVIGFNLNKSDLTFERSIINLEFIKDYAYSFRVNNSLLSLQSSVLRNFSCTNSVSFFLNAGNFEGINNSVFNIDLSGRGFTFWISGKTSLTSVNSIYYFNQQQPNNTLMMLNSSENQSFKPVYLSNAISSDIRITEDLENQDYPELEQEIFVNNLYYDFTNEFNVSSLGFFIPMVKSPIMQGGINDVLSPLKVPALDFFGRNRILPKIGIDLGAVQKSGNF